MSKASIIEKYAARETKSCAKSVNAVKVANLKMQPEVYIEGAAVKKIEKTQDDAGDVPAGPRGTARVANPLHKRG